MAANLKDGGGDDRQELARLRKRVRLLEDILNASPDMVTVHNRNEEVVFSNWQDEETYWEYFGGAVHGRKCHGCYLRGEALCETCQLEEVFRTGLSRVTEQFSPEEESWHSVTMLPVRNARGDVDLVAEFVRDVSASRLLERELRVAKEAAESADKAKGDFLASMSHEIRTPMNGVLGMLDLALDSDLTEEQREYLEAAQNSAESLLSLINDILDFSKIEAGMVELDVQAFRLRKRLATLGTMFGHRAKEKGVDFIVDVADDVPDSLEGDPMRLRQILVNLIGNALKFTEKGSIRLSVRPVLLEVEDAVLEFSVADTGIGIEAPYLERIFERFVQADASTTRRHKGTGLGLSITRSLVDLMEGDISVESTPGKGSTFRFTARFARGVLEEEEQGRSMPLPKLPTGNVRVLLAEDHPVNRLFMEKYLRRLGCTVRSVHDGTEVLPALAEETFDIILMDIAMPVMDGLEAVRLLRASSGLCTPATVPVIAMTAHAMAGDREYFLEQGMDDYVGKPINTDHLRSALIKHIPGLGPRAPEGSPPEIAFSSTPAPGTSQAPTKDAAFEMVAEPELSGSDAGFQQDARIIISDESPLSGQFSEEPTISKDAQELPADDDEHDDTEWIGIDS